MVEMYNEIVKRQEHPTCAMRAYVGNLMPQEYTGVAPGVAADRSVREAFMKFDLAVISVRSIPKDATLKGPVADRVTAWRGRLRDFGFVPKGAPPSTRSESHGHH